MGIISLIFCSLIFLCGQKSWASTSPILEVPIAKPVENINGQEAPQPYLTPQKYGVISNPSEAVLPARPYPGTSQDYPVNRQPYPYQARKTNLGPPAAYSVKNAIGLSFGSSNEGPYTSGYSYISSRTHHAPPIDPSFTSNQQVSQVAESRQYFDGLTTATQNSSSGFIEIISIIFSGFGTYVMQNMSTPESMSALIPAARNYLRSWWNWGMGRQEISAVPVEEITENTEGESSEKTEESRRKKRSSPVKSESDLADLTKIVVSAIQSGECMQRSVCILGSQIGQSYKGKIAFILMDKLAPESVRGHEYFKTLRKSLGSGMSYCDRFECNSLY